jgi:hypothetical protein
MNFLKIISNWFGLNNGKLIGEPPAYVDKQKIPDFTFYHILPIYE